MMFKWRRYRELLVIVLMDQKLMINNQSRQTGEKTKNRMNIENGFD